MLCACVCLPQVAWFTAIFPYVVLLILLVRGLTLRGASVGLQFYLEPSFQQVRRVAHPRPSTPIHAHPRPSTPFRALF